MLLQKTLVKNNKADLYLDLVELGTGLALVGFLWAHMIFVATVIISPQTFDNLAKFFDDYLLSYTGIPIIIIIALVHFVVAGRRIPTKIQDQKIIWRHSQMLRHFDTWTWVFQTITGMAILALAGIHLWMVLTDWPIRFEVSSARISAFWWYYLILLLVGEYHAGFGIYRQFVKWGWFPRKPISYISKLITLIILILGLAAMAVFMGLGGALS